MGSDRPATNATAHMPAEIGLLASRRQVLALVAGVAVMPLLPRLARAAVLSAGTAETWATGGTKSMTDKATYPDPFTDAPDSCLLVAATTEGPCTTTSELLREDVSEGWTGLPVRLALRVVDESCNPLAGATVTTSTGATTTTAVDGSCWIASFIGIVARWHHGKRIAYRASSKIWANPEMKQSRPKTVYGVLNRA
jgi:hypothetical protein